MKLLLLFSAVALVATACTTLSNRRDLYNPSEDAGPYNSLAPAHRPGPGTGNAGALQGPMPPIPQ